MGKTKRPFWKRTYNHTEKRKAIPHKPVVRHFAESHGCSLDGIQFIGLDRIHKSICEGQFDALLLKLEACLIYDLRMDKPPGLNGHLSFVPFLQNLNWFLCFKIIVLFWVIDGGFPFLFI